MRPADSDDQPSLDDEGRDGRDQPMIAPRVSRRSGRSAAVGLAVVAAVTALGLPVGLLWAGLAPDVPVRKTADGAALTQAQPEEFIAADGWFTLLGLGFGVLAAIAVWLLLRRYRGPLGMVAVVVGAVGAAVVAWRVGRAVGLAEYERLLADSPVGETLSRPPDLRAGDFEWLFGVIPTVQGNLLLPAFGAAVTYTLLAGWSRHASLRPEPERDVEVWPLPQGWATSVPPSAVPPTAVPPPSVPPTSEAPTSAAPTSEEPGAGISSGSGEPPDPPAAPAPPEPGAAGSSRG